MDENSKATLLDIVDTPISPELRSLVDENGEIKQKNRRFWWVLMNHNTRLFLVLFLRSSSGLPRYSHLATLYLKDMYDEKSIKKMAFYLPSVVSNQQFKLFLLLPDGPLAGSISISPRVLENAERC